MKLNCKSPGRLLVKSGFLALFAHETARDLLLERQPRIVKILTDADLAAISRLFPDALQLKSNGPHALCEEEGVLVRFFVSEFPLERLVRMPGAADHRKHVVLSAARSSLFNVNAFFYDIEKDIFHDPLDQYANLKRGVFGTLDHPQAAAERCPILALKTARVFGETGFSIEEPLKEFLDAEGPKPVYRNVDDQIIEDFLSVCVSGRAYEAFVMLDSWGVLSTLLPELTVLKEVVQDKDHHPEGNGFSHTLRCLKCVKKPNRNLIMAILLHDTGKAVTGRSARKARTFPNHSTVSTDIARGVLQRFRFEAGDAEEVLFLVQNHMILDAAKRLPKGRLRRIFSSPFFPNLLELYRADLESGYHRVDGYYHAARMYKEYLRAERLNQQGVYV